MDEGSVRLWLEDEAGNEKEYELVGTFQVEEQLYMALLPVGEEGVVLTGFREGEEDSIVFEPILDEEEYRRAWDIFEQLFSGEIHWEAAEELPEEEISRMEEEALSGLDEDYCYEDSEGRLFVFGEQGEIIYLNQWGEPIGENGETDPISEEEAGMAQTAEVPDTP